MPCLDGGPSEERFSKQKIEAMLCAICMAIESGVYIDGTLKEVNWVEAGVSHEDFYDWWAAHKARDRERRERAKANRDNLQAQARAKLTPEEREALGI